nr:hypothetical protein [Tanacetum cinerariifolium]
MLPVELTNEDIRNSEAYKEYYAIASGAEPPKTKASVRKTKSSSDTTITPPTAAGTRLSTLAKGKKPAKSSKAKGLTVLSIIAMTKAKQMKLATKRSPQRTHISQASGSGIDEGTGIIPGVPDVPTDESDEEISWKSSDDDDDDNDDDQDTDNDSDDFVYPKLSIHKEEAIDEESFDPIVQTPKNSDDEGNDDASLGLNVGGEEGQDAEDDDEELYRDVNINLEGRDSSSVLSQFVTSMLNPSPDAGIDSLFETTPRVDVQTSTTIAPLTLTAPTLPPPTIPTISQAPTPPTTAPTQAENEEFLNNFDENIQKIIKWQVKEQTYYAVAADLSETELKKIIIKKMESNKSIQQSDEHRNLYKALVDPHAHSILNHNSIHQSRGSCVVGLFAVIDNEFEEWAWSCELTSFWPAAATVKIPASLSVLAILKPERLKVDSARMCEEASKVESCPSEIILDDLLALDSIVRFDFE